MFSRLLLPSLFTLVFFTALLTGCADNEPQHLPYLGYHDFDTETGDTLYHAIRDFAFVDQDSQLVTNETFAGKVYVADFFFTSCPTICPMVSKQMLRIYDKYADNDRVMLLSHTVDPKRDTVARLKKYAEGLGVQDNRWRFVTGDKIDIYDITYDYISTALDQPDAPGGIDHSGYILLIDEDRHLRAYANGTVAEDVDQFMRDVDKLLAEMAEEDAGQSGS